SSGPALLTPSGACNRESNPKGHSGHNRSTLLEMTIHSGQGSTKPSRVRVLDLSGLVIGDDCHGSTTSAPGCGTNNPRTHDPLRGQIGDPTGAYRRNEHVQMACC